MPRIMPRHILLRIIFLLELAVIAYLLDPIYKTIVLTIIIYELYASTRGLEAKSLAIYIAIITAGYTISARLAQVSLYTWLNGLLNILSIGLALGLIVVTITPRDIDHLATVLHLPRTLHLILRTSLVNIRQLLVEVWEAHNAVKAKYRGTLKGENAVKYTGKLLVTATIIALTRSNQIAEALLLNPPPTHLGDNNIRMGELFLTILTTSLTIMLILLRFSGITLPSISLL